MVSKISIHISCNHFSRTQDLQSGCQEEFFILQVNYDKTTDSA